MCRLLAILLFVAWISFLHAECMPIRSLEDPSGTAFAETEFNNLSAHDSESNCPISDEIPPQEKCPTCNGTKTIPCPDCGGKGYCSAGNIHGQPAAYGCVRCGGVRGDPVNGPPGSPGSRYIQCPDCGGTGQVSSPTNTSSNQPSAVDRTRALEEQREKEAEEARRKQQEFEKAKQDALKSMKGIEEKELGLKDVSTGGDLGLKNIGESTQSPLIDCSVVDLRDKKQPLIVDPNVVKGNSASLQTQNKFLFGTHSPERDRDLILYLFPKQQRNGMFPKNPEQPLINPLREPKRWKEYDNASRADLDARIRNNKAEEVIRRMDEDPALNNATERILKKENVAIYEASEKNHREAQKAFEKLDKRYGVRDFNESQKKIQEDPKYKQQVQAIVDNYWKKMDRAGFDARRRSFNKMLKEVDKFQKRRAQQEREGNQ